MSTTQTEDHSQEEMHFNIGLAGRWGANPPDNSIITFIKDEILVNITKFTPEFQLFFEFYACPIFADGRFGELSGKNIFADGRFGELSDKNISGMLNLIQPKIKEWGEWDEKTAATVFSTNINKDSRSGMNALLEIATANIYLAIVAWDEKEISDSGSTWAYIENCKHNFIPCILIIFSNEDDRVAKIKGTKWLKNVHYEEYSPEILKEFAKERLETPAEAMSIDKPDDGKRPPLYKLLKTPYNLLEILQPDIKITLDDYKAEGKHYNTRILSDESKEIFEYMNKKFVKYDKKQGFKNDIYKKSIYFRSNVM